MLQRYYLIYIWCFLGGESSGVLFHHIIKIGWEISKQMFHTIFFTICFKEQTADCSILQKLQSSNIVNQILRNTVTFFYTLFIIIYVFWLSFIIAYD